MEPLGLWRHAVTPSKAFLIFSACLLLTAESPIVAGSGIVCLRARRDNAEYRQIKVPLRRVKVLGGIINLHALALSHRLLYHHNLIRAARWDVT